MKEDQIKRKRRRESEGKYSGKQKLISERSRKKRQIGERSVLANWSQEIESDISRRKRTVPEANKRNEIRKGKGKTTI